MYGHKVDGVDMKSSLFNVSIITISLALTGCNMLPDISRSSGFGEDIMEQEENQQKRLTQTQMTNFIAEWQDMKPAIKNLISLESDLQFILYQLEQEQQPLQSAVDIQSEIKLQERDDSLNNKQFASAPKITEKFAENPPEVSKLAETAIFADAELLESFNNALDAKPLESFDDSSRTRVGSISESSILFEGESTGNKSINSVQAQVIKPFARYLMDSSQRDDSSDIDAKFTQQKQQDSVNQIEVKGAQKNKKGDVLRVAYSENTLLNGGVNTDKFRAQADTTPEKMGQKFSLGTNPSRIVGELQNNQPNNSTKPQEQSTNCRQLGVPIGSGYALHLASYSKQSNAKAGWSGLVEKFNKSLCGLTPVLKDVSVNGKQFFSLRAGGFQLKDEADSACAEIAETKQYCKSTRFDGIPL
jgi:hypothetical protein